MIRVFIVFIAFAVAVAGCTSGTPETATTGSSRRAGSPATRSAIRGADLPISCGPATQKQFDRALFLLHNMMYSQARGELESAARANGTCAMLYWGIAMTWFWPLWSGQPTVEALTAGAAAVEQAKRLDASERERAYVAAVAGYYKDWQATKTATRLKNWEASQRELAARYPEDVEAQSFWALSLLATADRYDKTYAQQLRAARLIEKLLARRPEHPGLLHNLVHAYDNPAHSHQAVAVADHYKDVAPRAPHALHMPSHIYVRLGRWTDVIASNIKSAAAAREQPAPGGVVSRDFLHASDYLVYAYLQRGDDAKASEVLAKLDPAVAFEQDSGPGAYALAAAPARFAIERFDWKSAANLPIRRIEYTWDKFPWAEAVVYSTRALGAARLGDVKSATRQLAELDRLKPLVESSWWQGRIQIEKDVVASWVAHEKGDDARALEMMKAAASKEIQAGKESTEPGHVIHAAEQLGFLMLELKRPEEALAAFEAALADSPKRFNSLLGAGQAAEAARKPEAATKYYAELVQMSVASERPGYKQAKAAVGGHK